MFSCFAPNRPIVCEEPKEDVLQMVPASLNAVYFRGMSAILPEMFICMLLFLKLMIITFL